MNDVERFAAIGHGAIQVDTPTSEPLKIMLAGPIKVWWSEGMWESPSHNKYVEWRSAVQAMLVQEGHLVYSPHQAFRGTWSEVAQTVNDAAILMSDVLINLTPPGVLAEGTDHEVRVAKAAQKIVVCAAPQGDDGLRLLASELAAIKTSLNL